MGVLLILMSQGRKGLTKGAVGADNLPPFFGCADFPALDFFFAFGFDLSGFDPCAIAIGCQ